MQFGCPCCCCCCIILASASLVGLLFQSRGEGAVLPNSLDGNSECMWVYERSERFCACCVCMHQAKSGRVDGRLEDGQGGQTKKKLKYGELSLLDVFPRSKKKEIKRKAPFLSVLLCSLPFQPPNPYSLYPNSFKPWTTCRSTHLHQSQQLSIPWPHSHHSPLPTCTSKSQN